MRHRPAYHQKPEILWVVVADSKNARIFQYEKMDKVIPIGSLRKGVAYKEERAHQLRPVPDGELRGETLRDYDIDHTKRGSGIGFGASTPNTYEPEGDIKVELRHRLVKNISVKLQRAWAAGSFDHLVLVAPAKLLGDLRKQLAPGVQKAVVAVLPRDLARYEPPALLVHLQDTLNEARA